MEKANLIPPSFEYPTLQEAILQIDQSTPELAEEPTPESIRAQAKKEHDKARTTWFCIGYSSVWGVPISKRLKRLRDKYNLSWLRNSMSYHKFSNLGEKFNGDLNKKVMKDVIDFNLRDRECNCDTRTLTASKECLFEGKCRRSMVVYELYCKLSGKSYYGKTQQYLKKRTMQHIQDVLKIIQSGRTKFGPDWYGSGGYNKPDSFSKHFANLCRECNNYNEVRAKMKTIMKPSILWQGPRILCMKSARTLNCKICMEERKTILAAMEAENTKVINDNSDIFSSCKCGSKFHKFFQNVTTILRTRLKQKKVNSSRRAKHQRSKGSALTT